MLDARLPHLPDEWSVWAFSDAHGVTSALTAALREAGLVDADARWIAPPRTALVGCGDYIDRGGDVRGLVALLRRLHGEAAHAGSAVVLARGNHELMPLLVRRGEHAYLDTWLQFGGQATMDAFGCGDSATLDGERMAATIEGCAPGFFDWLDSLPQAVRWRDVLLVHGGLAPGFGLDDLGTRTEDDLWVRAAFFETPWGDADFDAYRDAGIGHVVFGHTPQPHGSTSFHDGHSLNIDTNAVGNPLLPDDAVQELTLLKLGDPGPFTDSRIITIPTHGAPDTMDCPAGRPPGRRAVRPT